ncbi:MAG: hypothetical protein JW723_12275 [Bacteroidales bacterium]|nr:hypothetical protein [Bacteroidales bacterium]
MEKKLIFENTKAIEAHRSLIKRQCEQLNEAIEAFHSYQPFKQLTSEASALEYLTGPLAEFDNTIISGLKIHRTPGLKLDCETIAQTYGINRPAFIQATKTVHLNETLRKTITWQDGKFIVNEDELQKDLEQFKVYAETPEEIETLDHWKSLRDILNEHLDRKYIDKISANAVCHRLGTLQVNNEGKFELRDGPLAAIIKNNAPVRQQK